MKAPPRAVIQDKKTALRSGRSRAFCVSLAMFAPDVLVPILMPLL